jgi:hypothetical protein
MPTLRELQSEFLEAILAGNTGMPAGERLAPELVAGEYGIARGLAVHADIAEQHYIDSLRKSYPVVHRLVGEDYFGQCAREFRRAEPSRSGDLQAVGAGFPAYWQRRHGSDEYRYLADIAGLEWLYQESLTAADHPPFDLAKLARVPPTGYDALRFRLHPSVRTFTSDFPALAIWRENRRTDREPELIDLRSGGERLMVVRTTDGVAVRPLAVGEFVFLQRIARAEAFAACVAAAAEADALFDATVALERFVRERVIVDLVFCSPTAGRVL